MKKLSTRRRNITHEFIWNSIRIFLTIGFDDDDRVRETFMTGGKESQGIGKLISSVGIAISLMLSNRVIDTVLTYYPYTTEPMPCGNININEEDLITVAVNETYKVSQLVKSGEIVITYQAVR